MKLYRNGAFGQNHLTMHDILSQAGEDGLLNKMCLSEITSLRDSSKGISKHLFHLLWANRKSSIANIAKLEKEIALKQRELEELQKQFDVYKAKMESLLISQLELLKDVNKD